MLSLRKRVRTPTFSSAALLLSLLFALTGCSASQTGTEEVKQVWKQQRRKLKSVSENYSRVPSPSVKPLKRKETTEVDGVRTLRDFIRLALERNPDIAAAYQSAQAGAKRIPQVTALPNPMLTSKFLPEPIRTAEGDNPFILGVNQKFPIPQKLSRAGEVALEETRMAIETLKQTRLRVIADVKRNYFRLYVFDKSIEVTKENQKLLRGLIDVARAQVASGNRSQDDVLRAQVELSNLQAEIITLRQRRESVKANLNALIDRPTTKPIPTPADFGIRKAKLSVEKLLDQAAQANPELHRLEKKIERDKKAVKLAKLAYWPDFTLGYEWMLMESRSAPGSLVNPSTGQPLQGSALSESGSDNWALTFGFTMPIWFDKIEGGIEEAKHKLASTKNEYTSAQNRINAQIEDALWRVNSQRDLAELFESTIIPQAQQTYQVSQVSYIGGNTDFLDVVDNWRKWLVFTIQYYRSLGALEEAVAELEQAVGTALEEKGKSS